MSQPGTGPQRPADSGPAVRADWNRRIVTEHNNGRICEYCRPGCDCVVLWRANCELEAATMVKERT